MTLLLLSSTCNLPSAVFSRCHCCFYIALPCRVHIFYRNCIYGVRMVRKQSIALLSVSPHKMNLVRRSTCRGAPGLESLLPLHQCIHQTAPFNITLEPQMKPSKPLYGKPLRSCVCRVCCGTSLFTLWITRLVSSPWIEDSLSCCSVTPLILCRESLTNGFQAVVMRCGVSLKVS